MPPLKLTAQWSNTASAIFKQLSLLCYRFVLSKRKQIGCMVAWCLKKRERKRERREGVPKKDLEDFL